MPPSPADTKDPIRDWLSSFGSGLELLLESLRSTIFTSSNNCNSNNNNDNSNGSLDKSTKRILFKLSVRCLILQSIFALVFSISGLVFPSSFSSSQQSHLLFFPYILFFRYLFPKRWDSVFMSTVRSLRCTNRSDVVAKPRPRYFVQLKSFFRRLIKAHVELKVIHWLAFSRTRSIFYYPSVCLALLAAYNYLKSKPIILIWKVVLVLSFIFAASDTSSVSGLNVFPRVPILFMKTVYIQDWLLYEILQPYLCRVQFKPWEERAWFEKYQTELYGFIVGTWIICTIPWIGVAALPFMFPAVAFLLTKSCGSMENSSQGRTSSATRTGMGDLIEQRSPGVKLVAQGTHPAVRGDWEGHKVLTMIQSDPEYLHQAIKDFKPEEHNIPWKNSALHYSVDNIHREEVTKEEIEEDRKCSLLRREALYQEAEREAVARHFHNSHSQHRANHGYGRFGGFGGFGRPESFGLGPPGRFGNGSPPMMMWDMHMDPRFSTEYSGHSSLSAISLPSAPPPEASASSSSASPLSAPTLLSHSPPTTIQDHASEPIVTTSTATTITAIVKEDLTRYNFSDRKTLDSAPSAPFEEDIVQSPISDTLLSESNYINANFREGGQNSMDSEIHSTHSLTKRKRPTIQAENEIQAEDQDLNEEQDEAGTTGRVRKEENSLQCLSTNRRGGFGSPRSGRGRGGFGFGHRKSREDNMEDNNNTIDTNEGRRRGIGAFRGFMQSVAKRHQDHRDHRHHGGFYRTQSQNQRQGHHQGNKLDVDEHAQRYDHHYPHLYRSRSSPIHSSHLTSTDDVSPPTTTTAAFTTTTTSTPESSNSEHSIGSGTVTGSSDLLNFSDALLYGLSHLEQHLNQRMQAWGHQWFQKVREAITDPNHPSVFRYQRE